MGGKLCLSTIILMLALSGCIDSPEKQENIWLYTYPVGCTDNRWQQEWVVSHDMNFSGYPQDKDAEIFVDFMKARNITLLQFVQEPYPIPQELAGCQSCSCPRGDLYRILVPMQDLDKAKATGFKEPPKEIECSKDEDCTTAEDCCGCRKGGTRTTINKDSKKQWEKQLNCAGIKCPENPSNYPYCNQTLTPKCQYNECHLA